MAKKPRSFELSVSCSKCDKSTKAVFQFGELPTSNKVELECEHCKRKLKAIAHVEAYLIRGGK